MAQHLTSKIGEREKTSRMEKERVAFYGSSVYALPKSLRIVYEKVLNCELLPIKSSEEAYDKDFELLLLYGGGDISPHFYGQVPIYNWGHFHLRDNIEWILTRRAIEANIPTLGICRGMQMLNIALGGSLFQDINLCDVSSENHTSGFHPIEFRSDFPGIPTRVNSRHHQCVRKVAPGLKVQAYSLDGVPEMIGRSGFVGVQWHPESLLGTDQRWVNLFRWHTTGLLLKYYPKSTISKKVKV